MSDTNKIPKKVALTDGTQVPALGQGTWRMGENSKIRAREIETLRLGIDLGMTLIDTAEMYGSGQSETLVGEAIQGRRDDVFLVSKVYPHNAGLRSIEQACENSLKRLNTDRLDLYLLHWKGNVPLAETIAGMSRLKEKGKILRWGVSNFDIEDMQQLWNAPGGPECATNQVLYHLASRGIEYSLMSWQRERDVPVMAYCPLAQGGYLSNSLLKDATLQRIADQYEVGPLQIALAWTLRSGNVISIPKTSQPDHVRQNAAAASIELTDDEINELEKVFPKPHSKIPLDIE